MKIVFRSLARGEPRLGLPALGGLFSDGQLPTLSEARLPNRALLAAVWRLGWLIEVKNKFGGVPTRDELYKFAWDTLNGGHVIPGYGHAVLRVPDPRYMAQLEFAKKRFPEDELVRLAELVFDVVPQVLKEQGKAKNPAPNVDAISGTLQYYYGVREFDFYTV